MDKQEYIKEIIAKIQLSDNTEFKYDELSIVKEYRQQEENKSSLAIKVLSVFGGLLATLAFMGFLLIAGLYDSKFGLIFFGVVFIVASILLNKAYDKIIIDTLSVSTYVIAYALLAFGMDQYDIDDNIILLLFVAIAAFTLYLIQSYILSFISILITSGSLMGLIIENDAYNLIHLYIAATAFLLIYFMLNEAKIIASYKKLSKMYNPIRVGFIFSLIYGLGIISIKDLFNISQDYIWLSSIVMFSAIMYLVYRILDILGIKSANNKTLVYITSALVLIPTVFSPSISGAILIVLLSFLINYKTGFVIGIISFVYFLSQYYYDLNYTLLTKSIILFSSGTVFIMFYLFTVKKLVGDEKL
ncbi:MAG: DUF4401 domain-containing protein [Bacteroidota bacterium]